MIEKLIRMVSILIIVSLAVAISGCTSSGNDTKVFEDQYVKFSYPANWVVVNQSEGNSIEILFFTGKPDKEDSTDPKYVGAIESADNPASYLNLITEQKTIQDINGKNATVFVDKTLGTYNAIWTLKSERINGGLYFSLNIMQPEAIFNLIKNSLIIKLQTQEGSQNEKLISPAQAKAIANDDAAKYNMEASGIVEYYDNKAKAWNGNPFYHVNLKYKNSNSNSKVAYVRIDAKTGKINP